VPKQDGKRIEGLFSGEARFSGFIWESGTYDNPSSLEIVVAKQKTGINTGLYLFFRSIRRRKIRDGCRSVRYGY
jgi:hypothetical protein